MTDQSGDNTILQRKLFVSNYDQSDKPRKLLVYNTDQPDDNASIQKILFVKNLSDISKFQEQVLENIGKKSLFHLKHEKKNQKKQENYIEIGLQKKTYFFMNTINNNIIAYRIILNQNKTNK